MICSVAEGSKIDRIEEEEDSCGFFGLIVQVDHGGRGLLSSGAVLCPVFSSRFTFCGLFLLLV